MGKLTKSIVISTVTYKNFYRTFYHKLLQIIYCTFEKKTNLNFSIKTNFINIKYILNINNKTKKNCIYAQKQNKFNNKLPIII